LPFGAFFLMRKEAKYLHTLRGRFEDLFSVTEKMY